MIIVNNQNQQNLLFEWICILTFLVIKKFVIKIKAIKNIITTDYLTLKFIIKQNNQRGQANYTVVYYFQGSAHLPSYQTIILMASAW